MVQRPPIDPRITALSGITNFGYPTGTRGRNGQRVQAVIVHRMQGDMAGTLSWFRNPASSASSTYGVGKDGTIVQYVHPDNAAWANGDIQRPDPKLPWLAVAQAGGISANLVTESIEAEGYEGEPWPEPQYQAILAVVRWRLAVRGLPANRQTVVGHYQLNSVTRAGCPGTNFPWARLMADLTKGAQPVDEQAKRRAAIMALGDRIPYEARGSLRREGGIDLSALGGAPDERLAIFDKCRLHSFHGVAFAFNLEGEYSYEDCEQRGIVTLW